MALPGPFTQKEHMSTQQPEALRLAELLTADEWPAHMTLVSYARECVAELRRLHALNAELLEALRVAEASVGDMGSLHIVQAAIAKAEGREA